MVQKFRLHTLFYVSLFHEYYKGGDGYMVVQPVIIDGEPELEVDRILSHCKVRGIT